MKIIEPSVEFITPVDGTGDSFVDLAGYAACAGEIATATPRDTRAVTIRGGQSR